MISPVHKYTFSIKCDNSINLISTKIVTLKYSGRVDYDAKSAFNPLYNPDLTRRL